MKFKYNYFTNTLKKLEGAYSYEICENKRFYTSQGVHEVKGFQLGEKEWIIFTFSHFGLKVNYQKGKSSYQKILPLPDFAEITFEFNQADRINSS